MAELALDELADDAGVVRAGTLEHWLAGDAARARAETEARAILGSAQAAREAERARGFAEGQAAAAEAHARAIALAEVRLAETLAELERALPDIVSRALEEVVGALDAGTLVRAALRRALGELRRGPDALLRVAPDCADAAAEALQDCGLAATIRLETDPGLAPGRCLFESGFGAAELGLAAQLRLFRETLDDRWGAAT